MKLKLIIILLILFGKVEAQKLNRFGHFEKEREMVDSSIINLIVSQNPALNFGSNENCFLRINGGYIFLSGDCQGSDAQLQIYNESGKESFSKSFSHLINFSLSPDKSFGIFHDMEQINVVDLKNFKIKSFEGSNIYSINNSGEVAYYNEKNESVYFKKQTSHVDKPIYKTFIYKDRSLFVSRNAMLELINNRLIPVFSTMEGRIFDVAEFNEKIYISVKTERPGEFNFKSFSSGDLVSFKAIEEISLPLYDSEKINDTKSAGRKSSDRGELVRDPIFFANDTVYQPIGNSYGEIQDYGSPPYLHPGVDLLGSLAQDVHSVKKGYVKAILTTSAAQHWRIAIANENTANQSIGYLYAHLDEFTIPYVVGDSVNEGDIVGHLVDFGVPGFNHCHFSRIVDSGTTWFGAWWTLDNPLSFMSNFYDTVPPVFEKTINNDEFAFRDVNGNYLSPDSLYGGVRVISKFYDIVNSSWHVDVNKIRFNLSPLSAPQILLLDTFACEFNFYTDVYGSSSYTTDVLNTIYSRDSQCFSVGNYNMRDFYHIVSSSDGNDTIDGNDSLQLFNTMNFFDGQYIIRIIASDASGNTTVDSMIIGFKNNISSVKNLSTDIDINISPNPSSDGRFSINMPGLKNQLRYDLYNEIGKRIKTGYLVNPSSTIDIGATGLYTLRIYNGKNTICKKLVRL